MNHRINISIVVIFLISTFLANGQSEYIQRSTLLNHLNQIITSSTFENSAKKSAYIKKYEHIIVNDPNLISSYIERILVTGNTEELIKSPFLESRIVLFPWLKKILTTISNLQSCTGFVDYNSELYKAIDFSQTIANNSQYIHSHTVDDVILEAYILRNIVHLTLEPSCTQNLVDIKHMANEEYKKLIDFSLLRLEQPNRHDSTWFHQVLDLKKRDDFKLKKLMLLADLGLSQLLDAFAESCQVDDETLSILLKLLIPRMAFDTRKNYLAIKSVIDNCNKKNIDIHPPLRTANIEILEKELNTLDSISLIELESFHMNTMGYKNLEQELKKDHNTKDIQNRPDKDTSHHLIDHKNETTFITQFLAVSQISHSDREHIKLLSVNSQRIEQIGNADQIISGKLTVNKQTINQLLHLYYRKFKHTSNGTLKGGIIGLFQNLGNATFDFLILQFESPAKSTDNFVLQRIFELFNEQLAKIMVEKYEFHKKAGNAKLSQRYKIVLKNSLLPVKCAVKNRGSSQEERLIIYNNVVLPKLK